MAPHRLARFFSGSGDGVGAASTFTAPGVTNDTCLRRASRFVKLPALVRHLAQCGGHHVSALGNKRFHVGDVLRRPTPRAIGLHHLPSFLKGKGKVLGVVAVVAKPMNLWKLPAVSVRVVADALLKTFAFLIGQPDAVVSTVS